MYRINFVLFLVCGTNALGTDFANVNKILSISNSVVTFNTDFFMPLNE